jgi:hypothetical protein
VLSACWVVAAAASRLAVDDWSRPPDEQEARPALYYVHNSIPLHHGKSGGQARRAVDERLLDI